MAAVASAPAVNGNHTSEKDSDPNHSPSRFTAVNGQESVTPAKNKKAGGTNGHSSDHEEPRDTVEVGQAEDQERNPIPSLEEDRRRGSLNGHPSRQESERPHHYTSAQQMANMHRQKRKRSVSEDSESSPNISQHVHSRPISPTGRPRENSDVQPQSTYSGGSERHHRYSTADRPGQGPYSRPDSAAGNRSSDVNSWHGYDSRPPHHRQPQNIDSSDAQLAEALQRDVQSHDGHRTWVGLSNRSEEDDSADTDHQRYGEYSQERTPSGTQHVGPKRKRVFSNRTKTGCMTCRRRKKKCDELHPACNNCLRGGFICEGYSVKNTWQKPSNSKGPVPLQSKDGYSDMPPHNYGSESSPSTQKRHSVTQDGGKVRPAMLEDHEPHPRHYMTSPTAPGPDPRGSWQKPWPNGGTPSYLSEHLPKTDYREIPPPYEISRAEQSKPDYHGLPPISHALSQPAPPKQPMSMYQSSGMEHRSSYGRPHVDTSSPQDMARSALSMDPQRGMMPYADDMTEKEKMLRGKIFEPKSMVLQEDRERCQIAVSRYNNACNPLNGVDKKERARLFEQVVKPPSSDTDSPSAPPSPRGSLGPGVIVEAPFRCTYGYNINISEDVYIGENCNIADHCAITIGAKTWIGADVTILGGMAHSNMEYRHGSNAKWQGAKVTIETDCWIGPRAVIFPGVTIRRGACVDAGCVVKEDVPQYFFTGNRPKYMT